MYFIKNKNNFSHIMQFSQFSSLVGIKRFKKLHRCSNDNLCIPILCCHFCNLFVTFFTNQIIFYAKCRLMTQNLCIITKNILKYLCCLFNDAVIRNYIYDSFLLFTNGSFQRKLHTT